MIPYLRPSSLQLAGYCCHSFGKECDDEPQSKAAALGTETHKRLEMAVKKEKVELSLGEQQALAVVQKLGRNANFWAEQWLEIELIEGIKIGGTADLILTWDRYATVVDYKRTGKRMCYQDTFKYTCQLQFYMRALARKIGCNAVGGVIVNICGDIVSTFSVRPPSPNFEDWILSLCLRIGEPPRPGPWCDKNWCKYRSKCEGYERRQIQFLRGVE